MYNLYNFLLYSFLGFICEIIFKVCLNFSLHSGILFGPYCPVYGFGIAIIFILFEKVNSKFKFKKTLKYILFFIISFIILSLLELIGGYLIEFLFHKVFWNYSDSILHIGKYVSIEMSLLWAFASILTFLIVKPYTDKIYFKINKNIIKTLFLIMLLDSIITIILKFK